MTTAFCILRDISSLLYSSFPDLEIHDVFETVPMRKRGESTSGRSVCSLRKCKKDLCGQYKKQADPLVNDGQSQESLILLSYFLLQ